MKHFVNQQVAIQCKQSHALICKGKIVEVSPHLIFVLPDGVKSKKEVIGFATTSTWYAIHTS